MTMSDNHQPPLPLEELFDHVSTLAGLSYDQADRAEALNKLAERVLAELNKAHGQSRNQIQAIASDLQLKYAPAGVEAAAVAARRALTDFQSKIQTATEGVEQAARGARQELDRQGWRWPERLKIGGACLLAGMVLALPIARVLPIEWQTGVAALVMKDDRWNAGEVLMRAGDADQWDAIKAAVRLSNANRDALAACRKKADSTGKEQDCPIKVSAP